MNLIESANRYMYDDVLSEDTRFYSGDRNWTSAKTSIKGKVKKTEEGQDIPSPVAPIIDLINSGKVTEDMTVLDYGAGKYARNADEFRRRGIKAYAYDPFNGEEGANGWEMGKVAKTLPKGEKFDVAFSSFVLNVVKQADEEFIINDMKKYAPISYHVTRDTDVIAPVKTAIKTGKFYDPTNLYGAFFMEEFANDEEKEAYQNKAVTPEMVLDFGYFGFPTGEDKFQRIPHDETVSSLGGSRIARKANNWKMYEIK